VCCGIGVAHGGSGDGKSSCFDLTWYFIPLRANVRIGVSEVRNSEGKRKDYC